MKPVSPLPVYLVVGPFGARGSEPLDAQPERLGPAREEGSEEAPPRTVRIEDYSRRERSK